MIIGLYDSYDFSEQDSLQITLIKKIKQITVRTTLVMKMTIANNHINQTNHSSDNYFPSQFLTFDSQQIHSKKL